MRKTVTVLEDDLTGQVLQAGRGETIAFGLDGQCYEIDLSGEHASELRHAMQRYTGAARKTRSTAGVDPRGGRRLDSARRNTSAIRGWARDNGNEVSDRRRISAGVVAAYDAGH